MQQLLDKSTKLIANAPTGSNATEIQKTAAKLAEDIAALKQKISQKEEAFKSTQLSNEAEWMKKASSAADSANGALQSDVLNKNNLPNDIDAVLQQMKDFEVIILKFCDTLKQHHHLELQSVSVGTTEKTIATTVGQQHEANRKCSTRFKYNSNSADSS